jgi:thiamine biosynthesis lipoprotein
MNQQQPILQHTGDYWTGSFQAMASPCELLMDIEAGEKVVAGELLSLAYDEALRIEAKFSRYRDGNIIHRINHSGGEPVEVDEESANLLDYADQCYRLSDGMFDITSGVLRSVWRFDGSDNVPSQEQVTVLLSNIGWNKVGWDRPVITLPSGMEIDLGGIGKEYAVDKAAGILMQHHTASVLVNFGGDIRVTGPRRGGRGWIIGLERGVTRQSCQHPGGNIQNLEITRGGVATSGDARRYLLKDGIRYGHILDPRSGWPVRNAPASVTVVAGTCTDAGILSTLAMLHGKEAESFLQEQGVDFWCER